MPAGALIRKPERLDFAEASAIGVNFVVGAVETAQLDKGETIAVFGVCGGVGSAVAQIARVWGAPGHRNRPGRPGTGHPSGVGHRALRAVRRGAG
ncbi:hypothetical protein AB0D27_25100 [Streptomyces sp. NPDC048415]|uniref:hypothetical protein n=1 Tax=Streptomyces sp. NPDC048415 TaxID=3154822 RepID=UPI00344AF215